MKLGRPKLARDRTGAMEGAVLPLINVVFLLMIFFLVAGQLGDRMEGDVAPQSWLSEKSSPAAPRLLRLLPNESLDADGVLISDEGLAEESLNWQGANVDVQADASIPAVRVLRVLNTLNATGAGEVRLLTVRPR